MKALLTAILMCICSSLSAQVLPEHSGSWYNPDQDGHGLSIEVIDAERSVAFWYTYDFFGSPMWFLFDGVNADDRIEATVYYFENMYWGQFNPAGLIRREIGTAVIEFSDCNQARLIYSLGFYGDGEIPLERLTHIAGMECNQVGKLAGLWSVKFNELGEDFWVDTTVDENGAFILYDEMGCIWEGKIKRLPQSNRGLSATLGTNTCGWRVPSFDMIGNYIEPYVICGSGGQCQTYEAAIGLEGYAIVYPGDDDSMSRYVRLMFLRPLD